MKFMRTRANNTQEQLAALFDVDQTTVCRYLQLVGEILNIILPTSVNISNYIQSKKLSKDQLKRIIPDNVLIIDGTHVPIQRPEDSEQRAESYSGKKKRFTINTVAIVNKDGILVHSSDCYFGKYHDFGIIKSEQVSINKMLNSFGIKIQLYSDRGFVGIKNIITNPISMQPIKKSKNYPLSKKDRAKNRQMNKKRVKIECVFALIKNYARMTDPYNGSIDEFRVEFNTDRSC